MKYTTALLLGALASQALGNRHHFCWCDSDQVPDSDPCLTQAACAKYPQDKFFGVVGGDPSAPTISKWSEKKGKCYGTPFY
ncbi:hypothetical protein CORC01_11169 [Colletotrichum orchidophilum]|uniref:Uncharacterized protein n=1 Tax=Colletotrichum orchidophilum TaxID=1209926 RepID=A0A1G4AWZ5_9PEZI|nr:uncharacterized protein CORC01_11169 [Colletotrichum orchidophilum]OHE93572.1 hypothetical protein CORC01_11169 [Colletotrichum orchidophilum]